MRFRMIFHRDFADESGGRWSPKMQELIPRQLFEVPIQAAIGSQDHRARNRNGNAQECHREMLRRRHQRKRKLLEKQKEGKKRMKRVGRVDIPQEAFLAVLKVGEDS